MGKCDSSKTRVVPVFRQLYALSRPWLCDLLTLPTDGSSIDLLLNGNHQILRYCYAPNECPLRAPRSLLSWLIQHPQELRLAKGAQRCNLRTKRRELLDGSRERLAEALRLLEANPQSHRAWYVFEGTTYPDVFIETEDLIIVIEGKRTEPKPTTDTEWMPVRHQMLRHMDAAWDIRGRRQVIGFFIVEADEAAGQVPAKWRGFARDTISPNAVSLSLPHRNCDEQNAIASCFAGVTTWQRVCREFGIDHGSLPNEVCD